MKKKIYIDGIFDLFHAGHLETLKYIKANFKNHLLVVGLINDKDATNYKREPIIDENNRFNMLESCKYIDSIIRNAPLIITPKFLDENYIDLVVHSFSDIDDKTQQQSFFKQIIEIGKFQEIPYSNGLSTSSILEKIKKT